MCPSVLHVLSDNTDRQSRPVLMAVLHLGNCHIHLIHLWVVCLLTNRHPRLQALRWFMTCPVGEDQQSKRPLALPTMDLVNPVSSPQPSFPDTQQCFLLVPSGRCLLHDLYRKTPASEDLSFCQTAASCAECPRRVCSQATQFLPMAECTLKVSICSSRILLITKV